MVRSVPGLEKAEFAAFAYAIEYDFYDARDLLPSLESKKMRGLFLAGQDNGTTGYEEAAAQGFIAGVNAVRLIRDQAPLVLSRNEAYIGVMIDDLVTKGTNEPYRMFTSRAERRLLLSQNSARYRLLAHAKEIGIIDPEFAAESDNFITIMDSEIKRLDSEKIRGQTLASLLGAPDTKYADIPNALDLPPELTDELEYRIKYRTYIAHEERIAAELIRQERTKILVEFNYATLATLRYEAREKFTRIRPENLGMASRIPGVTPADIAILAVALKKRNL
jgi:tRNA uridine 5-carboxymethylaminomethyl modification enzyme